MILHVFKDSGVVRRGQGADILMGLTIPSCTLFLLLSLNTVESFFINSLDLGLSGNAQLADSVFFVVVGFFFF